MALSTHCASCLLKKQLDLLAKHTAPEAVKQRYLRRICTVLAETGPADTAPTVLFRLDEVHRELLGPLPDMTEQKRHYNNLMLARLPEMEAALLAAENQHSDSLLLALQYAIAGNYIDFGAPQAVENEKLDQLLAASPAQPLDESEYAAFCRDAAAAKRLVYLTDNCGEVVADKLLICRLKQQFPALDITVIVRGGAVVNDATLEDAAQISLADAAPVLPSGCALAGTDPALMTEPARSALLAADVILAKGQGNFETLAESRLPVYFAFLCKCSWFTKRFDLPLYQSVFVARERLKLLEV